MFSKRKAFLCIKKHIEHVGKIARPTEVAAIHATILSILIGAFSAYFLYVHGEVRGKQMEAMSKAEEVNKIQFLRSAYFPQNMDIIMAEGPGDIENLKKNLIEMALLTSMQPGGTTGNEGHIKIPEDPAERAERILQIMNVVCHRYPFPKAIEGSSRFRPEPIFFTDIETLRVWLKDLSEVLKTLMSVTHFLPLFYPNQIKPYFDSLAIREKESIEKLKTDPVFQIQGERNPYALVNNFINGMLRADEIWYSTHNALMKADNLQKTSISKSLFMVIILVGFLVFFFAVILPLMWQEIRPLYYIYIPVVYYISIFCVIINKAIRL